VADVGLLAQDEDPRRYGFEPAGLRWSAGGLALYARAPELRASLALGAPPAGEFQPLHPSALELQVDAGGARIGDREVRWASPLGEALVELDIASLRPQTLRAGAATIDVPAGASTVVVAAPLGQALRLAGDPAATALLRVRVRGGSSAAASQVYGAAVAARGSFDGELLNLQVEVGGAGDIILEAQGAAASDDHPVHLFSGRLPTASGQARAISVSVLAPEAPWIEQQVAAEDGRYIAYVKSAARPEAPGIPVAQWSVRAGRVVDARVVPLPLTELR
jgi:hypothetical protein